MIKSFACLFLALGQILAGPEIVLGQVRLTPTVRSASAGNGGVAGLSLAAPSLIAPNFQGPALSAPTVIAENHGLVPRQQAESPARSLGQMAESVRQEGEGSRTEIPGAGLGRGFDGSSQSPQAAPLVLVQIDGLGHEALRRAVELGYAPNLGALMAGGRYRLARYRNGIPTVTMAVQAETFYGRLLPGNEWYSKSSRAEITANEREMALARESGLLHGGQVYLSELSGGAVDGADVRRILKEDVERYGKLGAALRELRVGAPLFIRYLLSHNPLVAVPRFLYRVIADALRIRGHFRREGFDTPTDRKAPVWMSLIQNLWSPIALEGLKRAIRKGTAIAYADLPGYDELAHYFGPYSPQAFEFLRRIDVLVGELHRAASRRGRRLVIFSDHGQVPTDNFRRLWGLTPQALVDRLGAQSRPGYRAGDLVFTHVYSMGNIYLKEHPGHAQTADIDAAYPGLVADLKAHASIGLVSLRRGADVILLSKEGSMVLGSNGEIIERQGADPLAQYADDHVPASVLAAQIRNYMALEEAGDIVVFAPYQGGRTVDFNAKYTLVSEHGGIGGEQMRPFLIYDPAATALQPETYLDARDLHRDLRRTLQ